MHPNGLIFLFSCFNMEPYENRWEEIRDFDQDGITVDAGDCNDTNALIHPKAEEICDGLDNDCDGVIDDVLNMPVWALDLDQDGYGGEEIREGCFQENSQEVDLLGDCNDEDPLVFPTADETWQDAFTDNDCDQEIEGVSYHLDDFSIPFPLLSETDGSVIPIILDDFEILKIAFSDLDGNWIFYRDEEILFKGVDQASSGTKGIIFQNQVGLEFWNEESHWLGFYSELDVLSQASLSFSNPKIHLPLEDLTFLEVSPDGQLLVIITENTDQSSIYIIDEIPTEETDTPEIANVVSFSSEVQGVSWVSDLIGDGLPQLLLSTKEEHIFFQRSGPEWQPFFSFQEPCEELIQIEEEQFLCRFGQEVKRYRFDNDLILEDSKIYESRVADIFGLEVDERREAFVILEDLDSENHISYAFNYDEIAISSSRSRKLIALSSLKLEEDEYFAYWDQIEKELFMVLMPSRR